MDTVEHIKFVIDKIRPYIISDGGDIEFVRFDSETGIVYVKLLGNCVDCGYADFTIKDTIEEVLTNEVPEVISVEQVL